MLIFIRFVLFRFVCSVELLDNWFQLYNNIHYFFFGNLLSLYSIEKEGTCF